MNILATSYSPEQWAGAITTLIGSVTAAIVAIVSLKLNKGNKEKLEEVHEEVKENGHES